VTRYERNGSDHAPAFDGSLSIRFQGDRMSYVMGKNDVRSTWVFVLSPGPAPRALTATRDDRLYVNHGIYRFAGDKLVICFNERGGPRPTEFDSRGNRFLLELRRR
jgi:uncharacterized protein (TIGR03067 family)